jgi:glucose uptake protein GlcU
MDALGFHLDMWGLVASFLWGSVGFILMVYGKKAQRAPQLFGGLALVIISYFLADSALWMSLVSIAILFGIYYWSKQSDQ